MSSSLMKKHPQSLPRNFEQTAMGNATIGCNISTIRNMESPSDPLLNALLYIDDR